MRNLSTSLLFPSVLLAGALTAPPLHAEGGDGGMMKNDQCGMVHGRQGGMMGGGRMMGQGGMMGQRGMMGQGGMMQGDQEGLKSMMKQMSQMMKQMSQMMEQSSNMMSDKSPNEEAKKSAPSEPEKK